MSTTRVAVGIVTRPPFIVIDQRQRLDHRSVEAACRPVDGDLRVLEGGLRPSNFAVHEGTGYGFIGASWK
jgi:hypothetical protein